MYSTPEINIIGRASDLIQGNLGNIGEAGVSGHTKNPPMQTELEAE